MDHSSDPNALIQEKTLKGSNVLVIFLTATKTIARVREILIVYGCNSVGTHTRREVQCGYVHSVPNAVAVPYDRSHSVQKEITSVHILHLAIDV